MTLDLPYMPPRITRLPRDSRGYPVPRMVPWYELGTTGLERCPPGLGHPDFTIRDRTILDRCMQLNHCWICGDPLGRYHSYLIDAMAAVDGVSSDPPAHHGCATWSARACPHIAGRRPDGAVILDTRPIYVVITSRDDQPQQVRAGGWMWLTGHPERAEWYTAGRPATRNEVMTDIDAQLPEAQKLAVRTRSGLDRLESGLHAIYPLLPGRAS